jgi:hypothetical protein
MKRREKSKMIRFLLFRLAANEQTRGDDSGNVQPQLA